MRLPAAVLLAGIVLGTAVHSPPIQAGPESPAIWPQQIEADWLRQDELRNAAISTGASVTPEQDAVGGCDGVKNGKWGFHTENEDEPWWQIDLAESTSIGRLVLYNRCDFADRTSRIIVFISNDGRSFTRAYQHNGAAFYGHTDGKPLVVQLDGVSARYVRLKLPGTSYFHLDEVEIYAPGSNDNIALGKAATQSSTSQWSVRHAARGRYEITPILERGFKLAADLRELGAQIDQQATELKLVAEQVRRLAARATEQTRRELYMRARRAVRKMAFANPLLDFDRILFAKRAPGTLPHISDQYYGWWSRPGGGIYIVEGFKGQEPPVRCLTSGWPAGAFLRPDLHYDGGKVLFAYCRYYPHVARMDKVDKEKLPEDAFYHIFEMNIDGTGVRQLTHGRYDDFDARYLPDDQIVFLSTRKGQFIQCTKANTAATTKATLPDSYVRCGGDSKRPVAVFTLHVMNADGGDIRPISAFENFEWTPFLAADGRILYARWDYIDRFNGHFMSLWSTNQNGNNAQLVYGNYTTSPQCIFEARPVPNSHKLVFTATAHHSITGGSLVLLDRTAGAEGHKPLTRLTPEVCFPEAEGWPEAYYSNPYPLSETYYLASWSDRRLPPHAGSGQVTDDRNPVNAMGIYLYDSFGNLELIHRDPNISSMYPIPVRPRKRPPVHPENNDWNGPQEGSFIVQDVHHGLPGIDRGAVKRIRIIGVPPKTQPYMNSPNLGVSSEDPGKFVIGTVPVEVDGSAYFTVPSGVSLFFQALDEKGLAVQTMRSLTYVQPGQTLSCIGCHESRETTPAVRTLPLAAGRGPSKITPGPPGSWPLRFDRLVQPVLDKSCVSCHRPGGESPKAAALDLTAPTAYRTLISFAEKDLEKLAFERDRSVVGQCTAAKSRLLSILTADGGHEGVTLDSENLDRLVTWMDCYAQRLGSFSNRQEELIVELRRRTASLLAQ
ncbi:MAG: discoidin domain-containing protein [Phycisphaerales bacterium]|nr:MAG: discoidin domain-containing protein [Phycisphaerales bacterium]